MSRTLIAAISLSFLFTACAHKQATAPTAPPKAAKAEPAPQPEKAQPDKAPPAKTEEPAPAPKQYEGPPPNRPARKIVVPNLKVVGRPGWIVGKAERYSMTIIHPKTGADITFIMMPTARLRAPVVFAHQLAAVSRKNGLKVSPVRVTKDGRVASFRWRQRIVKKGEKPRRLRGKARVAMDKDIPAVTVVMLGRWPAKRHRRSVKEFNAYARTYKVELKTIKVK